jgi:hypothetical protein
MARRKRKSSRGLGASDFAHGSMAGQKLLDLQTTLDNVDRDRNMSCGSRLVHLEHALADYGEAYGHLRSTTPAALANLRPKLEHERKRIVRLSGSIRQCFR